MRTTRQVRSYEAAAIRTLVAQWLRADSQLSKAITDISEIKKSLRLVAGTASPRKLFRIMSCYDKGIGGRQ